jgi:hypothetical protein
MDPDQAPEEQHADGLLVSGRAVRGGRILLATACLALAALAGLAGPAAGPVERAGANGTACRTPAGYTVAARSSEARVFVRRDAERALGCLLDVGRLVEVGVANERYWLAGRFVAYSTSFIVDEGSEQFLVYVVDLRRNKNKHVEATWYDSESGVPREDQEGVPGRVTDLTLKRNGSVGWISCHASGEDRRCGRLDPLQVWRADRRGARLLEESTQVDRDSLTRRESTIRWVSGGERRSASLK